MSEIGEKFMRVLVLFDLPTQTKKERKIASRLRQFLKKDGYIMLQYSVYARICKGQADIEKHEKRLKCLLPEVGSVRMLTITEKQYVTMKILFGRAKKMEEIGAAQLVLP